jgi:Leucine-rich repeat (LRR) protein
MEHLLSAREDESHGNQLTVAHLLDAAGGSEDNLLASTSLRLTGLSLSSGLDCLELVTSLTTLYLNDNHLTSLIGIEVLSRLKFLDISFNRLGSIAPCEALHQLQFLDARSNAIAEVRSQEGVLALPPSLRILNLSGNPCCRLPEYRQQALLLLPSLVELDKEPTPSAQAQPRAPGGGGGGSAEEGSSLSAIAAGALERSRARQAADKGVQ